MLFSVLYPLSSTAQNYQWKWALSGGGMDGGTGDEDIHDIKVGTDGNYYFIATVGALGTKLDGVPVTNYNILTGGKDIFLFSTTCDGTVRWKQALGGGSDDLAYNLVLDSNNNVYIGGYFGLGITNSAGSFPVHFSPTETLPLVPSTPNTVSDHYKTLFLVKYDSNGVYRGKKALQGDVSAAAGNMNYGGVISDLAIDSQNNLHFIVGLLNGTHLDARVTVPMQYKYNPNNWTYNLQYHLVQYDTNLDYVNSKVLPFVDGSQFLPLEMRFVYDETLNRYYIGGGRADHPFAYNGNAIVNRAFVLAINGTNGNEVWRREIYAAPVVNNLLANNYFRSLKIDDNSDVYFSGNIYQGAAQTPIKIYDPTNTNVVEHTFTPTVNTSLPTLIKFNSNGVVQWVKQPTAFAPNFTTGTFVVPYGLAFNGNEVAFGSSETYFVWDGFTQNNPLFYQPDPTLLRFNKQTGMTLGMHDIKGDPDTFQAMTAVATDNDGNYITGGSFQANLFLNNTLGVTPLISAGQSDFFVAKLEANPCGSGPGSTKDFIGIKVKVYPNPTTDILNIETDETLSSYIVYDMLGRRVQNGIFGNDNQINLQTASSGTYFVKVTTIQGNNATVKVIKK